MKLFNLRNQIWKISCRNALGDIKKDETKLWDIRQMIQTIGSYK